VRIAYVLEERKLGRAMAVVAAALASYARRPITGAATAAGGR
jgi:hypothetical protein